MHHAETVGLCCYYGDDLSGILLPVGSKGEFLSVSMSAAQFLVNVGVFVVVLVEHLLLPKPTSLIYLLIYLLYLIINFV